jgi:hypothetical protein
MQHFRYKVQGDVVNKIKVLLEVALSMEHSDDGLFDCSVLNINSNQTESFKVRLFLSDFAIFIRG